MSYLARECRLTSWETEGSSIVSGKFSSASSETFFEQSVSKAYNATLGPPSVPVAWVENPSLNEAVSGELIDFVDVLADQFCDYVKHHIPATDTHDSSLAIVRAHAGQTDRGLRCIFVTISGVTYAWEPQSFDVLYRWIRTPLHTVRFDLCEEFECQVVSSNTTLANLVQVPLRINSVKMLNRACSQCGRLFTHPVAVTSSRPHARSGATLTYGGRCADCPPTKANAFIRGI